MKNISDKTVYIIIGIVLIIFPLRILYFLYEYLKYGIWNKISICYFEDTFCKSSWIGINKLLLTNDFSITVFCFSLVTLCVINLWFKFK